MEVSSPSREWKMVKVCTGGGGGRREVAKKTTKNAMRCLVARFQAAKVVGQ